MSRGQIRDILSAGEVRRPSFSHIVQSGSPIPIGDCSGGGGDIDATFFWRLSKLGKIGSNRLRFDDDFVDRLNYQFTGLLLFMFIGLIGIRQYVGKPIQCWIPQEFTRGWEEYTENYCWVSNTYFALVQNKMPHKDHRQEQMIGYYQWAPIFLSLQSLFFYIPCILWRHVSPKSGFNVRKILQVASDANCSLIPEQLQKSISFIARHMDTCMYRHRICYENKHFLRKKGKKSYLAKCFGNFQCFCCFGKREGNFLSVLYLMIKLLYLVNIICQLYLMEKFIGTKYTFYGVRVLLDLLRGVEWHHSGNFPRVTFCDLEAKKLGKNHLYSLQCVLPMNMFLEKIYIFLWFWHIIVGFITICSLLTWLRRICSSINRVKTIRNYLRLMNALHDTDKGPSRKFAENYLRSDGCFIIHLIAINIGDLVAGDLICELWQIYRHKRIQEFEEFKFTSLNVESRLPSLMLNNTSNLNDYDKNGSSNNNGNHDEIV